MSTWINSTPIRTGSAVRKTLRGTFNTDQCRKPRIREASQGCQLEEVVDQERIQSVDWQRMDSLLEEGLTSWGQAPHGELPINPQWFWSVACKPTYRACTDCLVIDRTHACLAGPWQVPIEPQAGLPETWPFSPNVESPRPLRARRLRSEYSAGRSKQGQNVAGIHGP